MATEPESDAGPIDPGDDLPENAERREFLVKASSMVLGGAIVTVPAVAGVGVFISPLLRTAEGGITVKLTTLDSLPEGGDPQRFRIEAEKSDAWTRYRKKGLGSVYLHRVKEREVIAFNSSCPHAGCAVNFESDLGKFNCPCHQSLFDLDGAVTSGGKKSPAARGLDTLPVEVRDDDSVWVTFMNFKAGIVDKVPVV